MYDLLSIAADIAILVLFAGQAYAKIKAYVLSKMGG